jgi:hypothetical protein
MYPNSPSQPPVAPQPGNTAIHNPLAVMQPGEHVICEVKRHPFGILTVFIGAGVLLVVLAILAFGVAPTVLSDDRSQVLTYGGAIFAIVAVATLVFVFISQKVYWGNSWVVTSDSVTQITQVSLFNKRSSQLSLGNLEDIAAEQNGILAHLFNFGNLKAETAGERSKFVLTYCPNPSEYARQILMAREVFEQNRHGGSEGQSFREPNTNAAGPSWVTSAAPQPIPNPTPTPPSVASYEVPTADGSPDQPAV